MFLYQITFSSLKFYIIGIFYLKQDLIRNPYDLESDLAIFIKYLEHYLLLIKLNLQNIR